jgi:hypothetical protein
MPGEGRPERGGDFMNPSKETGRDATSTPTNGSRPMTMMIVASIAGPAVSAFALELSSRLELSLACGVPEASLR